MAAGKSKRGLSATKSRSSGMKGGMKSRGNAVPAAKRSNPGPRLPGEKTVRETRKTVGVKPARVGRAAKAPMDPNAIDRRRQIIEG
jgi:hypothetical protein